jgi:hypothetical protein
VIVVAWDAGRAMIGAVLELLVAVLTDMLVPAVSALIGFNLTLGRENRRAPAVKVRLGYGE